MPPVGPSIRVRRLPAPPLLANLVRVLPADLRVVARDLWAEHVRLQGCVRQRNRPVHVPFDVHHRVRSIRDHLLLVLPPVMLEGHVPRHQQRTEDSDLRARHGGPGVAALGDFAAGGLGDVDAGPCRLQGLGVRRFPMHVGMHRGGGGDFGDSANYGHFGGRRRVLPVEPGSAAGTGGGQDTAGVGGGGKSMKKGRDISESVHYI